MFVAVSEYLSFTDLGDALCFLVQLLPKKRKLTEEFIFHLPQNKFKIFRVFLTKLDQAPKSFIPSHYVRQSVPANFHKHVYLPSIFENIPLILLYLGNLNRCFSPR